MNNGGWNINQRDDGSWEITGNDWNGEEYHHSGDSIIQMPAVPKCECGQESTWQHNHRRSCPPHKHSEWCKLYVRE